MEHKRHQHLLSLKKKEEALLRRLMVVQRIIEKLLGHLP